MSSKDKTANHPNILIHMAYFYVYPSGYTLHKSTL